VLLTNSGRIDPSLRIFAKDFSPIAIFSTTRMPERTQQSLTSKTDLWLYASRAVPLADMLTTLRAEYGVKRLVCEGGAIVFRSFLTAGLVDEIHVTLAPRIFGGKLAPTLTGVAESFLPASVPLQLRQMEVIGNECFLRYRVVAAAAK
jgi:5-amino-6-(5-phosphoribosylamino)uracil reductase